MDRWSGLIRIETGSRRCESESFASSEQWVRWVLAHIFVTIQRIWFWPTCFRILQHNIACCTELLLLQQSVAVVAEAFCCCCYCCFVAAALVVLLLLLSVKQTKAFSFRRQQQQQQKQTATKTQTSSTNSQIACYFYGRCHCRCCGYNNMKSKQSCWLSSFRRRVVNINATQCFPILSS